MSRLLDPKILMSIKDLHLAAKTAAEGMVAGIHTSQAKGVGMEFSQYRSYQPGDDLRSLDWKMFARSDRYYIREAETERNTAVKIMIDASASMNHADGAFTKLEYGRYLAASLAYLASQQGDSVGLFVFEEGRVFSIPDRNGPQQMARLYHALENIQAGGTFTKEVSYQCVLSGSFKREILIFITDYYEQTGEITNMLSAISGQRQEVMVLHLMAQNEMELNYKGYTAVEDLETGKVIKIEPQQAGKLYQQQLTAHLAAIKSQLLQKNIFYHFVNMDEPLDVALQNFLNLRNHTKR